MPRTSRLLTRSAHHRIRTNDEGSLLIVAILVGSVALSLGLIVTSQAIITSGDSGRDRQRTGQVHAAEAGVDSAYYQLQLGSTPCTLPTFNVGSRPDTTEVSTSISYYDANGGAISCATGVLGSTPAKAAILANATSTNRVSNSPTSTRTMESQVLLSPTTGGSGYAIYSAGPFAVPNSFNLTSNGANPPDVYTREGFYCANSATLGGSVFSASGNVQLGNSCLIQGGLSAKGKIDMANTSRVARDVSSSQSDLVFANSASVGGNVRVRGTFTGDPSKVGGTVTTADAGIPDPLDQPLPWIGYDPVAWTSAGFTIEDYGSDADGGCAAVKSRMLAVTTPTVFYADCVLAYSGNNTNLRLKTDVALFLPQGMKIDNNFSMASDTSQVRKLWVISPPKHRTAVAPAGWTAADCDGKDIIFSNQTDFASTVNLFLYTCKAVQAANNSTFTGQIYGSTVNVANNFNMAFVGLPPVGVNLGGSPVSQGFRVEVLFKRET